MENFELISKRRDTIMKEVKEANIAIERERKKEEVKRNKDEGDRRKRGGVKNESEKQYKLPTRVHLEKISAEFTPLMGKQWAEDMRLYIRTCSNLEILSTADQRTVCNCFVNSTLWSHVVFFSADNMVTMVKRVEEAFDRLQPLFSRKVKFLDLMILKGEGYAEWAMIIELLELADLDSIQSKDLKLMKYCQGLKPEYKLYD